LKSTKGDALMFISTFLATILLPNLDKAIYLGNFVSLIPVIKVSEIANIDLLYTQGKINDEKFNIHVIESENSSTDVNPKNIRIINIKVLWVLVLPIILEIN